MLGLWRGCAVSTPPQSTKGKTLGDRLPELWQGSRAGADPRRQASAMYFDLRAFEKRPGGDDAPVREHIPDSRCGPALLQHIWDAPVALESLHGSSSHLCLTINESQIANRLRRRPADE